MSTSKIQCVGPLFMRLSHAIMAKALRNNVHTKWAHVQFVRPYFLQWSRIMQKRGMICCDNPQCRCLEALLTKHGLTVGFNKPKCWGGKL